MKLIFVSRASRNAALIGIKDCHQFCVKLGKFTVETSTIKTTFRDYYLSERQVYWWHNAFLEIREKVSDEVRCGPPLTITTDENVAYLTELINSDRDLSVRTLNIPKSTVYEIVTNNFQIQKLVKFHIKLNNNSLFH